MDGDLLQTKFYVPQRSLDRQQHIPRPHLIEQLNRGVQLGHKLTLVSAPAGFGKTTLIAEWADAHNRKRQVAYPEVSPQSAFHIPHFFWLSLDEGDNDPSRFLAYFITALSRTVENETTFGEKMLDMLQSPQPTSAEVILTALINKIASLPEKIIFVLDDYHCLESPAVDEALTFLLEHLPSQMQLVIATRDDPQLPLARIRARGQLTELRAADLRFTSAEAAQFLNQVMGLPLAAADIAALEARTEGWIAGLQLAAIALQGTTLKQGVADTASRIKSFTGSHRFVMDYLIEEVLEQQPDNVQTFLLQTAVLNRLTGSLCDALTGQDNGQETLEMLERANLFIVPLDEERRWYRYHHLFADLLRQRLRQTHLAQIPRLHQRASQWYEQKDLLPDAIRHALAGEDFERAAALAEFAWPAWSGNLQSITWRGWVNALPDELVRARPVLSVAYAQALLNAGKLEAAETRLLDAERWLEPTTELSDQLETAACKTYPEKSRGMVVVDEAQFQVLPAWLATTRAYHAQAIGDLRGTVKYVERALDLFPKNDYYNRAAVTGLLGLSYWASGDLQAAYGTFSDGLFQNSHDRIKGTFILADMQMTLGNLREAESVCENGLKLAKAYDKPMPTGTEDIYSGISEIHREQGKLETAVQDLQMCKKLGDQVELPDWQHRYCIAQARLDVSMGNLDVAIDLLDEAALVYVRTPVPDVRPITAMKARVWVRQSRLMEALAWVRERRLSVDDDLNYMREFEHITLVRVLIAQYKNDRANDSIQKATSLLERLLKTAEAGRRMGTVIEILVLRSLVFEAKGKMPAALTSLERALTLAKPEGYHQLFVDEGLPMAQLLKRVQDEGSRDLSEPTDGMKGYIHILLDSFEKQKDRQSSDSAQDKRTSLFAQPLIDPLSEREIEVLHLIAEGLTNPEIASRLFLTLNTVKVHTRNIYSKLDVHTRTQAVFRARDLGILSAN